MDNTEGSRAIAQVYKARKSLFLRLSKKQLAILIGSLLGDAYVYPQGKICFEHGYLQKDYLLWKYQSLRDLAYPKISLVKRYDRRYKKWNKSFRFFLRQYFRPLRQKFYSDSVKVVPKFLPGQFTPLSLAVWYMDDGSLDSGKYPIFASESFIKEDLIYLKNFLSETFGLNVNLSEKGRIRIVTDSRQKFYELVRPFMIPSLSYKLP